MTMFAAIEAAPIDGFDALVAGLRAEFGCADVAAVAERFVEAELPDFLWENRRSERRLGVVLGEAGDDLAGADALDRIAIVSQFRHQIHVAIVAVDRDGGLQELLWTRAFGSLWDAEEAYLAL